MPKPHTKFRTVPFRDILGLHRRAKLPGDDVAREVVEYGRQIKPAPADDLEIGEVGLP